MTVLQYAIFAAIFFGVPADSRLWGAVWGYTISWGAHLVMLFFYLRRVNRFRFTTDNLRLLATSFVAVVAVAALPFQDPLMRLLGVAIALTWAFTSITSREVDAVKEAVRARLRSSGARLDD
jgi:hypothetical protein